MINFSLKPFNNELTAILIGILLGDAKYLAKTKPHGYRLLISLCDQHKSYVDFLMSLKNILVNRIRLCKCLKNTKDL